MALTPSQDGCKSCLSKFLKKKKLQQWTDRKSYCFSGMRAVARSICDHLLGGENVDTEIFNRKNSSKFSDPAILRSQLEIIQRNILEVLKQGNESAKLARKI